MKRFTLLLVLALVAAACVAPAASTTAPPATTAATTTTTAPPQTTTTVIAGLQVDLVSCTGAPAEFDALCNAYQIISSHYVDPVSDETLAEGAAKGVAEADHEDSIPEPDRLTCALPTPDFDVFCDALAEHQRTDPEPVPELIESAISGMMESLGDPNSVYFTPEALSRFEEETTGQIEGIGALVRAEDPSKPEDGVCQEISDTCLMTIVSPLEGSPAEAAGIKSGDVIIAVDGESIKGWLVDEVVAAVRGPKGTKVTLTIDRSGETLQITITRDEIKIPVVTHRMIEPGIGYVELSIFSTTAPPQFRAALEDLLAQGAETIIFDLQFNPGGSLNAAIQITSEFLDEGLVLRTQSRTETNEYRVVPGGVATNPDIAVYVLVNRGSASASEVVTGALQDAGRATAIGEHTFGKNTVQQQFDLSNGGALKLTIARWVTPSGHDYGHVGLTPDILIEIPGDAEPDYLLNKALEIIKQQ